MASSDPHPDPLVAPALRLPNGRVVRAPATRADGTPYRELMHGHAVKHAIDELKIPQAHVEHALLHPDGSGFVTRSGKYLSRRDAVPKAIRQLRAEAVPHAAKFLRQYQRGEESTLDSQDIEFAKARPGPGRGDALQPWAVRKKRGPLAFNEDPVTITLTAPGPMRRRYNAPVSIVGPFEKALRTIHLARPVETRSAVAPADWHHAGSAENPLNRFSRVVQQGDTLGKYEVKEVQNGGSNLYHVHEVQALTRGGGRAAMTHLTQQADRHGVSLRLIAEPLRPQGEGVKMSRTKLRSWYREFGFRPQRGDLMVRTPVRSLAKAIDYDALEDQHEPRPKKSGKGGKGSPVGSRTQQARHQTPAYQATKARIAALKPEGVAQQEWQAGVKHEAEHQDVAPSKVAQAKIAAAHLKEEPRYYSKLDAAGIK